MRAQRGDGCGPNHPPVDHKLDHNFDGMEDPSNRFSRSSFCPGGASIDRWRDILPLPEVQLPKLNGNHSVGIEIMQSPS